MVSAGAKEEVRKLMSVLLQRESKYNHEIRSVHCKQFSIYVFPVKN
jgi:hypothetical protein